MKKQFIGVRLRRLREEKGLTQAALAKALDLSASYLNQLEQNQRPLTLPVLMRLNEVFGIDARLFSEETEARLLADLREAVGGLDGSIALADLKELASAMPDLARVFLALHGKARGLEERLEHLSARHGGGLDTAPPRMPFEEVRDFFYAHRNHFPALERLAEDLHTDTPLPPGGMAAGLADLLARRHGVTTVTDAEASGPRRYDPAQRRLTLSADLSPGQRAFHLATQWALLDWNEPLETAAQAGRFSGPEAHRLARIGLASYAAGAIAMPYAAFLTEAEARRYDIDLLARRFGVGFETICHRLSTLQRPEARGIPFFFIRVDRAGNISKRQSATDFHFSKVGGSCPLWSVYAAFEQPGRILTQRAQMPDGREYFWIARTVTRRLTGYGQPEKNFAIGLGCDARHAARLIYSKGLDLTDPDAVTPIGAGCKLCERPACPQRAFPALGRPLDISEAVTRFAPYPPRTGQ